MQVVLGVTAVVGLSISLFGACADTLNMGNKKITHLATPTQPHEAVNKAYVDQGGAGVTAPVGYGVIYAGGMAWLDRNAGATKVADSLTDTAAYGNLYQWGRPTDGHQNINSSVTTTLANSPGIGHNQFIASTSEPYDWTTFRNGSGSVYLWKSVSTASNHVCPVGWRVPSIQDFAKLGIVSSTDAFNKIKLTITQARNSRTGDLSPAGTTGHYWTSSTDGRDSYYLYIHGTGSSVDAAERAYGFAVRCVKHL